MTVASITVSQAPQVQHTLRWGDACLILAQRISEWCGHAPILEEDIALANTALDLIGQARALLAHAGQMAGQGLSEDQLAFLREERDYRNPTLAELPRGDFAFTALRNALMATWLRLAWEQLAHSSDEVLVGVAAKAVKEARYHQQHFSDWVVRLGDGTAESARRMQAAVDEVWRFLPELFTDDAVDAWAAESGSGPAVSTLKAAFDADVARLLQAAKLSAPADSPFVSTGRQGVHSEHLGPLLATLQHLQRSYPGGVW